MAVAITAALYGTRVPPAVLVTITGLDTVDRLNVWREPPSSPRRPVRGGVDVDPAGVGTLLLVDVEAELGRPLVYVVEYWPAGDPVAVELSADPVTVPDTDRHVLSDIYTGAPVFVDVVAGEDERTNAGRGALMYPQGGTGRPIVLTDTRQDDTGTLTAYTRDRAETLDLVELLAPGAPIVSRHPADGCDIPASELLWIGDAARSRRTRQGDRRWALPFAVVDDVDPELILLFVTLADLHALYLTGDLADIAADFATLLELAQSDLGTL